MKQQLGLEFRRSHQGSFTQHAQAAQECFRAAMRELDSVAASFVQLSERRCGDEKFNEILLALIP
ncbi:MAG: hypothetical protein FJW27_19240 [Acidimicrobiia bacterium]|nr:hypothetical protein [Acidimicrobiia bacterium]